MNNALNRLLQQLRVQKLAQHLKLKRHDELGREQAQAVVRLVNTVIVLIYLLLCRYPIDFETGFPDWLVVGSGFIGYSALGLVLALRDTAASLVRRMAGNVADVCIVSYLMIATGEAGVPLFILYLSVTLGNGFRFGLWTMVANAALCIVGFSVVLAVSPVWNQLTPLATAIIAALVLLPVGSARFLAERENVERQPLLNKLTEITRIRHAGLERFLSLSSRFMRNFVTKRSRDVSSAVSPSHPSNEPVKPSVFHQRLQMLMPHFGPKRLDELGRERGQAVVRLINSVFVLAYFLAYRHLGDFDAGYLDWAFGAGFIAFSALLLTLTLRDTASSTVRCMVGNVGDVSAVSYGMIATGAFGIPLFILYLSITLGNGFRFGLRALMVSAILCLVGFSVVIALSAVWKELPVTVPIAIALALMLLPAYAAHLISQLTKATKRAEEASVAKSRFLARMSHELRTPLNGILGSAELLTASKRVTHEDRSLLNVIKESVHVSMRQIDNVLDFSKIEAGKLVIERVDFDLHELLNRAMRLVRSAALEKKLRLTLRVDPTIPHRLIGDPHHLNEVFLNLLSNAVKFTREGYVSLEARLVQADAESALVRFEVHDSGIGIEPAAIARIFEAFSQENTSTTRRYGGTGLGTTIAKQVVELMGGQLRVESVKGQGSTFYADIRLARQTEQADERAAASLQGMRLLLITKDAKLHRHVATCVAEWGASIKVVASIEAATGALKHGIRLGNPIRAVLADAGTVFTPSGAHCAEEFIHKASLSATPVFLVCDACPLETQLRQWGYAWVLAYEVSTPILFTALHASSPHDTDVERGIARVEPWAWAELPRKRPRVLIADDNPVNLMVLKQTLQTANYVVDAVDDGEKALQLLLSGRYKVAVLDMHMPGLDGTEVIKQYRMMRKGARTFVIVLTANATLDAKIESAEAGADFYLSKPAPADQLLGAIEKALSETEVYELSRRSSHTPAAQDDVPILDTDVIREVDRVFADPKKLNELIEVFESESRRLLSELATLLEKQNHGAFWEHVHALKSMSLTVGALRLAQACLEIEGRGVPKLNGEGEQILVRLEATLVETVKALRELTVADGSKPESNVPATRNRF